MTTDACDNAFDEAERRAWAGRGVAYAGGFAKLCAHPVPRLLDLVGAGAGAGAGAGVRVLDVGTGSGAVAAAACGRGARVTAVDAEPSMLELASRAAPAAEVRRAALPELPFADDEFDAVVGNFVLNHVGRPREALAELRRVTRPDGRIAVTVWAAPAAPGQALLGRALRTAGVGRPEHLPTLDPGEDFARTEQGFAALLGAAGLRDVGCETVRWNHRTTPEEWWSGPAAGVATIGQIVTSQPAKVVEAVKGHFDTLCAEFTDPSGALVLPHAALAAHGRA